MHFAGIDGDQLSCFGFHLAPTRGGDLSTGGEEADAIGFVGVFWKDMRACGRDRFQAGKGCRLEAEAGLDGQRARAAVMSASISEGAVRGE